MGTNYLQFLLEAFRVTKRNGYLIIAELSSRLNTLKRFIQMIEFIGYKVYQKNVTNPMFVMLVFKRTETLPGVMYDVPMLPQHQDSFRLRNRMTYLEFAQMVLTPVPQKKK
jgi:ubiquinone/menaquinone biosynthesis C-methylase UbiE